MKKGDTIWILKTDYNRPIIETETIYKVGNKWVYYGHWGNAKFEKNEMTGYGTRFFTSKEALDEYLERKEKYRELADLVNSDRICAALSLQDIEEILNTLKEKGV
jgi:hypothetical protein